MYLFQQNFILYLYYINISIIPILFSSREDIYLYLYFNLLIFLKITIDSADLVVNRPRPACF